MGLEGPIILVVDDEPLVRLFAADTLSELGFLVLEAANDLGDHATVEICRRVIDASLNGAPASPCDLHVVTEYFR